MRTKVFQARRQYQANQWRPWFAWFPIKVELVEMLTPTTHRPPYLWLWLEWVETKSRDNDDMRPWRYRLPAKKVADDGQNSTSP